MPMKKLFTAASLALTLLLAPLVTAGPAQAACNTTSWTWPFCHIGKPSIPRFDMGGPRPPLTPKTSAWCTQTYIPVSNSNTAVWLQTQSYKYDLRFWPDYYWHHFVGYVFDWDVRKWVETPYYVNVFCDA
jgi:hypothetical protein